MTVCCKTLNWVKVSIIEIVPFGLFEKQGWVNFNQNRTQFWEVYEDENSLGQSIALGSYRSGDKETISWLITPEIEVSSLPHPYLAFRTSTSFADNSNLSVFVATFGLGWRIQLLWGKTIGWN